MPKLSLALLLIILGSSAYAEPASIASWHQQALVILVDPNIAYVLLLIAIYGLLFEFMNPGLILPGVAGVIALFLTLYIFQILPINYVGLSLLLLGLAFIIAELFVISYGILGIGGALAFIAGSFLLFNTPGPGNGVAWQLIVLMGILTLSFFLLVAWLAVKSQRKKVVTGKEAIVGSTGVILEYHSQENMVVRIMGEIWQAHSTQSLKVGQKIRVIGMKGLILKIEAL